MVDDDDTRTLRLDISALRATQTLRRPSLTVLTGTAIGQFFALSQANTIIGRSSQCTIRLEDQSISRQHACFHVVGEHVFVEDLGSANGTYVNGELIQPDVPLQEGDKITLGKLTILRFSLNDVFDEQFHRKLYDAALRDGLTQAFNKRHLLERLVAEFSYAKRHQSPLSLMLLDADHFKRVNDLYSHQAGDVVLIHLVAVLQGVIRQEDLLARYGGEEFVVLSRGSGLNDAHRFAQRLCRIIADTAFSFNNQALPVTVSIGVAALPELHADTPEQLLAAADRALYQAKANGRNRVEAWTHPEVDFES
ncbi:MAG: GGDEF domain-containing protein [Myxococcota bacterium]|jgi:diguanylate cyclase (GGDEF)-like protein|nr:GGDEF domain-containing protein [Myxococcota bacterium]